MKLILLSAIVSAAFLLILSNLSHSVNCTAPDAAISPWIPPPSSRRSTAARRGRLDIMSATAAEETLTDASCSYRHVDLNEYLRSVEDTIHTSLSSSASPGGRPIIRLRPIENHRRVMIRTLLDFPLPPPGSPAGGGGGGGSGSGGVIGGQSQSPSWSRRRSRSGSKVAFEASVREARKILEHKRLSAFIADVLDPALDADGGSGRAALLERNPNFESARENFLGSDPTRVGAAKTFARMASGPVYRGDAGAMLRDVLGAEAAEAYEGAVAPPSDEEAIEAVIRSSVDVDEERREAAMRCLQMEMLQESSPEDDRSQAAGSRCENMCVDFLRRGAVESSRRRLLILENVFVKRATRAKQAAALRAEFEHGSSSQPSGVIVTSKDRDGATSEFDAVIVDEDMGAVAEIWESKHTISPCTIEDALSKKARAIRDLLEDEDCMLLYPGGAARLSSAEEVVGEDEDEGRFQFGMFGMELQPPRKAASQLKVVACQEVLSTDVGIVLDAVRTGTIELDVGAIVDRLERVRRKVQESSDDFLIRVVLAD